MKKITGIGGEQKTVERYILELGSESFLIAPQKKKYAPRKPEARHFADFIHSIPGSVMDETTYPVAEAKRNGVPVYQVITSVTDGFWATITLDKESRLFRRIVLKFRKTETIGDFEVESQQRNGPIPEDTFTKPGAAITLDPAILEKP